MFTEGKVTLKYYIANDLKKGRLPSLLPAGKVKGAFLFQFLMVI